MKEFYILLFNGLLFFSYVLVIFSYLGISFYSPAYLETIDYYLKLYVCLFLLIRFNPLMKQQRFGEFDRKIAFSAGLLIFTTTTLHGYVLSIRSYLLQLFNGNNNENFFAFEKNS